MARASGVIIVGGAAGSKIAWDICSLMGLTVIGFLDNHVPVDGWAASPPRLLGSYMDSGNLDMLRHADVEYFVATGDNGMRRTLTEDLCRLTDKRPLNAVHPRAVVSRFAEIGTGNLINASATINAFAKIGHGTIINTAAVVEHDCIVSDYAQVSPGCVLAGYVEVGPEAFLGSNATVIPHRTIGAGATVAAGAVVTADVPSHALVAGVPAVQKR